MPTISDLFVGERIKFGRYAVENEPEHEIAWVKAHGDNTFITEFIEDYRAFDAREPDNPSRGAANYGNNIFRLSNISQFLNSTEESWYQPTHEFDTPPTEEFTSSEVPYDHHRGFLSFFTEGEYEAIENTKVICAESRGGMAVVERKVFLPSVTNIFGEENGGFFEGEKWDLFEEEERFAYPTSDLARNTCGERKGQTGKWHWWLRSRNLDDSDYVQAVHSDGCLSNSSASYGCVGVRPALKLNPNISISEEPDVNGYYTLLINEPSDIVISPQELMDLWKH